MGERTGWLLAAGGLAAARTRWARALIASCAVAGVSACGGGSTPPAVVTPPVQVAVPGVVGLTQQAAGTSLSSAGLVTGAVTSTSSPTVPAGSVASQDPAAGVLVAPGTAVALGVSTGPATATVPDVSGLSQAAAEAALLGAGLQVGAISTATSATVPAGAVVSQSPAAGQVALALASVDLVISTGPGAGPVLPPDPSTVAPPIPSGVATGFAASTSFLYQGASPIQTGVVAGTFDPIRVAVLRGEVRTRAGAPLSGAFVTVLGHPEFGETIPRADARYDLAVNGGLALVVDVAAEGYLPAQRQVRAPWADYASVPAVVLVALDTAVTAVTTGSASLQVARATASTDQSGTRRSTVLFPAGLTASLLLADGTTVPAPALHVRSTEYTVGASGPDAMPGLLPPTSTYTYAMELSADEALAAGASHVVFSRPVVHYVENFLGFPTGTTVPLGWYDRAAGVWRADESGVVLTVLGATAGAADLAVDASGNAAGPDALAALGIDLDERQALASLYAAGQSLWRVRMSHFSAWDCNWGPGPPPDAVAPSPPPQRAPPVADPSEECGSIIGCETQTLGESLPVAGTPWRLHYRSDRTPGYRAESHLDIPLTGASYPGSLKHVELVVEVAGRRFTWGFAPAAGLAQPFDFDGKDAYGRDVWGAQPVRILVGYTYALVMGRTARFGTQGDGSVLAGSPARTDVTYWRESSSTVSQWSAAGLGLAGWSLTIHHAYDPAGRRLYYGDGRRREVPTAIIETIVPANMDFGQKPQNGTLAIGPDGSLYLGINYPVSGVIRSTPTGQSIGTLIPAAQGQVIGPDGSLYVISNYYTPTTIRRYPADHPGGFFGSTLLAGPPSSAQGTPAPDGTPAVGAVIDPSALAVGQDGSVYFTEVSSQRIRRIGTDGLLTTIAGNGTFDFSGDGGPATAAGIGIVGQIALAADGSIYLEDRWNARVRRITPDGIIRTVAGNGQTPVLAGEGDGGPATAAAVDPVGISLSPEGRLTILQGIVQAVAQPASVRMVLADGTITTIAGGGFGGDGTAIGANMAFSGVTPHVAWGPDRLLYVGGSNAQGAAIRRVVPALPGAGNGDLTIPDEDGREAHVFSAAGQHLRTVDGTTGGTLRSFTYDAAGFLVAVIDGSGNTTTVERSGSAPSALVGPYGQRTMLSVDGAGWLSSLQDPAGHAWTPSSTASGLLAGLADPLARSHAFGYDGLGRLVSDRGPGGAVTTLARTEAARGHTVTTSTALGRTRRYTVEALADGGVRRTVVDAAGTTRTWTTSPTGALFETAPDGTTTSVTSTPDPRWGLAAPVPSATVIRTPGGNLRTITATRAATLATPKDPFSATVLEETLTEAGDTWRATYQAATRIWSVTSPAGRVSTLALDALGRLVASTPSGLAATAFTYDGQGRLLQQSRGTRTRSFGYGADGLLSSITDPASRTSSFTRDQAGQFTGETLPGGRVLGLVRDAAGNLTSVTPPGRTAHTIAWAPTDLPASVTPPVVSGAGTLTTAYAWDADRELTRVDLPDGDALVLSYADPAGGITGTSGKLASTASGAGTALFAWDAAGRLSSAAADGVSSTLGYDGALVTSQTWTGAVAGTVTTGFDALHRPVVLTTAGVSSAFTYDSDGLVTGAGALAITRDAVGGWPTSSSLGIVTTSESVSAFGELAASAASAGATALYGATYARDALGRITGLAETVQGVSRTVGYTYDPAGRLASVTVNGSLWATYGYDPQGNRISSTTGGSSVSATFDAQDRLLTAGSATSGWTPTGTLASTSGASGSTSFQHDAQGRLRSVLLPDGRRLDYLVDGLGRRVGKRVNGALVEAFLHDGDRPVAWLDGASAVKAVMVYGPRGHAPEYLVMGAATYRIVADHLGSPRLVVDAATGAVAQRLDYDAFGQVLFDSNPGFQPFGFAGGLGDPDTGLVHFGARDYDPATGRWTSKDPLGFAAGDANLYAYAGNDPVNWLDPTGLAEVCAVARHVRPGDTLFLRTHQFQPNAGPSTSSRRVDWWVQPNAPVTFRGFDPTGQWVQIEVNGQTGYVLPQTLSTQNYAVEVAPGIPLVGTPMSNQAFASSGAATKA
jgi:RHS repeat-associated protein